MFERVQKWLKEKVGFDLSRFSGVMAAIATTMIGVVIVGSFALIFELPRGDYWPVDFAGWTEVLRNWGLLGLGTFGLWFALRRIAVMERQTDVSERDHIAARYENALKLLDSDSSVMRIAGMNGLAEVAERDEERYLESGLRQISAFLRQNRPATEEFQEIAPEFEEAFALVSRLNTRMQEITDYKFLDLRNVSFDNASLLDVKFDRVFFGDNLRFRKAVFIDCEVAYIGESAETFASSKFIGGSILGDYEGISFDGCQAAGTLTLARFIDCDFSNFQGCDIQTQTESIFSHIADQFHKPMFEGCKMDNAVLVDRGKPYDRVLLGGNGWGSDIRAKEFCRCYITHPDNMPASLRANTPPLKPVLLGPREEGGYYIEFREIEDGGDE